MSAPAASLVELTETDPMLRSVNHDLMVRWINSDLINHASNDVRRSVVLYDEDKLFVAALEPDFGPVPPSVLAEKLYSVGVRYFSKGIV